MYKLAQAAGTRLSLRIQSPHTGDEDMHPTLSLTEQVEASGRMKPDRLEELRV